MFTFRVSVYKFPSFVFKCSAHNDGSVRFTDDDDDSNDGDDSIS